MKYINMNNVFTVFGNFCVFDDDCLTLFYKVFDKHDISIKQEQGNPANKSGKVLEILDKKSGIRLVLRPIRLDVYFNGAPRDAKESIVNKAQELYSTLADILECSYASRIAYVSNDFIHDDDGARCKALYNRIHIFSNEKASELNFRINLTENQMNEDLNCVISLKNNCIVTEGNTNTKRKAIVVTTDINTLQDNNDERFELKNLKQYFSNFYDLAVDKLSDLEMIE